MLTPLNEATTPERMEALEGCARGLRRLKIAGRRSGGDEEYDRLLREAARQIGASEPGSPAERARLVEILAGPDAALSLLKTEPAPT